MFSCSEMVECFNEISQDSDCRVVVFSAAGKIFTAGQCEAGFYLFFSVVFIYLFFYCICFFRNRPDGHCRRRAAAGGRRHGQSVLEHQEDDLKVSGNVFCHREGQTYFTLLHLPTDTAVFTYSAALGFLFCLISSPSVRSPWWWPSTEPASEEVGLHWSHGLLFMLKLKCRLTYFKYHN